MTKLDVGNFRLRVGSPDLEGERDTHTHTHTYTRVLLYGLVLGLASLYQVKNSRVSDLKELTARFIRILKQVYIYPWDSDEPRQAKQTVGILKLGSKKIS